MRSWLILLMAAFVALPQVASAQPPKRPPGAEVRHIPQHPVTEDELLILQKGHQQARSRVIGRLMVVEKYKGRAAIEPAIPLLKQIYREASEKAEKQGYRSDGEGEFLLELKGFLAQMLKPGETDLAFDLMVTGQTPVQLFADMRARGVRMLADSLRSERYEMRSGAAMTLLGIAKQHPAVFNRPLWDLVRERLEEALRADPANPDRLVMMQALARFGDRGTLDLLAEVAESDPMQLQNGRYINRVLAKQARQELLHFLDRVDGD